MRGLRATVAAACGAPSLAAVAGPPAVASTSPPLEEDATLHLVTLDGPGTSAVPLPAGTLSIWMTGLQDQVLASVDAPAPVYRWTTALSGVAVELTEEQADLLAADPRVALVEPDRLLHLAGAAPRAAARVAPAPTSTRRSTASASGAGTVIGFVDSGLSPEGPVFAGTPGLGPLPVGFSGECRTADDWPAEACTTKVVAAQWFVDGFGADRVRVASSLSARDDDGHGTAVASVAAGNDGLTARARGQRLGRFGGAAPHARVAVYKACWTAPDPDDDGCAASDVVTAIDRATADGVDVLNVSAADDTARDPADDTVQRALLGAAEADVVVVAAAGNGPGEVGYAAPWVTTVGAVVSDVRRGLVERRGAPALRGVMVSDRRVGPARLVLGADAVAVGSSRADARRCSPGSLDAASVDGHVVLCARGGVGRVAKSLAVRQADGVGMVLANQVAGSLDPDLHAVPTVHVTAADGDALRRWLDRHPRARVTLVPRGVRQGPPTVATWSRDRGAADGVAAPDVLAEGAGVLAAGRVDTDDARWHLASGTSFAAATVSGLAASVRGRRAWSAAEVRSALAGTAVPVRGSRTGAGLVDPRAALRAALAVAVDPADHRAWLDGRRTDLGTAALALGRDRRVVTRTLTNLAGRDRTFTARIEGADGLRLSTTTVTLAPGATATVTVRLVGPVRAASAGTVAWRDGGGVAVRWPVVLDTAK